jgi:hypothetical protein
MRFNNFIANLADFGALNEVIEHFDFGYRTQKVTTAKNFHLPKLIDNKKSTKVPLRPG